MNEDRPIHFRALLLPGGSFWVVLLAWWSLRCAGLYAMRAFGELPFDALNFFSALAFDGLLVWGLFLRARAYRLLSASPQTRTRSWLRAQVAVELPVFALLMTLLRVVDVVACYFALSHVTEAVWQHISPGSLGYAADPRVLAVLAGIVACAAAVTALAWRDASRVSVVLDGTDVTAKAAIRVTVLCMWGAWAVPFAAPLLQQQHPHHWGIVAEVNAAHTFVRAQLSSGPVDPRTVEIPRLPASTSKSLRSAGLLSDEQDENADWPLLRRGIGAVDALPLRATATTAPGLVRLRDVTPGATRAPNVLVVLVESLNIGFTGLDARSRHPELMPRLQRWAQRMTQVVGFHNVASPTANGLVASLCATLPSAAVSEIHVGGSVDKGAAYSCISDVLRDYGYRSHFARGASKVYMACEASLRSHGFDEVYGREDLVKRFPQRPTNSWGYYDDTLVEFLLAEMDRLAKSPQPWLYATLTVNSHLPGYAHPSCKPPPNVAQNRVLTGYWCTDEAIDRLLKGMQTRGLLENTLVVITGDHAQLPTRKVQKLIEQPDLFGAFAPMPLLIHDPLNRLPKRIHRLSSQLDLAPTLLHLLGAELASLKHSFMGYSIFGERRRHRFLVGRTGQRSAYVQSATARASLAMGNIPQMCAQGLPLLPDGSAPISACELNTWFRWLDALWAGHRLFPSQDYRGGAGTEADLLRLKWLRYDQKEERARRRNGVKDRHE